MSDTFLERTSSNSSNNQRIGTISVWLKRAKLGTTQYILANYIDGNNYGYFRFDSSDRIHYVNAVSGSHSTDVVTSRKFKDTFAWYHLCVAVDSTQGTASNRVKIYVNGTQETAFDTGSYGSQDDSHRMWMASASGGHRMGSQQTTQSHFNGCMSHFHFIDGTAYAASSFGSTDSVTGEWNITTSPNVTYGSEGYFMLKNDNSLTDQSGEGNNFILGNGTFTKTQDNPSNVFATFNSYPVSNTMAKASTFSNGNTTVVCSGSVYNPFGSTIGVNKGKWYAEFKSNNEPGDGMIGVFAKLGASTGNYFGSQTHQYSWYRTAGNVGRIRNNSSDIVSGIGAWTTNDIIGIALDCDNNKLYMHKNGTYISNGTGTGNPSSGTNGISITDPDDTDLGYYFMTAMDWGGSGRGNWSANFGNGYFGTTAVATNSGNGYQDVDGIGIFNYTVPTNYRALCTKGLNE